jgi:carbonic anhydrase
MKQQETTQMQALIDHARVFHHRIASCTEHREEFARLAARQQPEALFVTCSDSRVVPALITAARPGQLFELRTAGNMVPPHRPGQPSGEAATIEYAVEVLGVTDVVICGHSHCGAMRALVDGDDLAAVPAVREWLAHAAPPDLATGARSADLVARAAQHNVVAQLDRLSTYPCVRRRLPTGRIRLHGWFYEVDTGAVLGYEPDAMAFRPL